MIIGMVLIILPPFYTDWSWIVQDFHCVNAISDDEHYYKPYSIQRIGIVNRRSLQRSYPDVTSAWSHERIDS